MSNSNKDAAFIKKGQREAVIGYKPQLGGSRNGFIPSIDIPEGNAADSGKLEPMVDQHIERTQIIPKIVSADDGYASAKGKSEVENKARNKRSSVESLMFTYKARPQLWSGNEAWYRLCPAELVEKVLAYNFCRLIELRKRKKELLKPKTGLPGYTVMIAAMIILWLSAAGVVSFVQAAQPKDRCYLEKK